MQKATRKIGQAFQLGLGSYVLLFLLLTVASGVLVFIPWIKDAAFFVTLGLLALFALIGLLALLKAMPKSRAAKKKSQG